MKKSSPLLMVIFLISFVSPVLAQEDPGIVPGGERNVISPKEWGETLDSIKNKTDELLKENDALNMEYKDLQNQVAESQDRIKQLEADIAKQQKANKRLMALKKDAVASQSLKEDEVAAKKALLAPGEAEIAALEKKLQESEKETADWKARISDLKEQKSDLLARLKKQDAVQQQTITGMDDEIKKLEELLAEHEDEGDALEKEQQPVKGQQDLLAQSNAALEESIRGLKDQEKKFKTEIAQVEKDAQQLSKSSPPVRVPPALLKEKARLEVQVGALESQLEEIRNSVESTSRMLEQKRATMDEIIQIDAQNKELRRQVEDLTRELNGTPKDDPAPALTAP